MPLYCYWILSILCDIKAWGCWRYPYKKINGWLWSGLFDNCILRRKTQIHWLIVNNRKPWNNKYRTMGFVCEVLICANYVSCHKLAHFNSAITLALLFQLNLFQLTAHVTVLCLWFLYPMSLFSNTSKGRHSASLPDPKGQRIATVVWITCMTTLHVQHFSNINVANSPKHFCRCGILWSQSNNSTLDLTSHTIACDDCMRSRNLVISYFADIIIADITAGKRNQSFIKIGPHRQNPLYSSWVLN